MDGRRFTKWKLPAVMLLVSIGLAIFINGLRQIMQSEPEVAIAASCVALAFIGAGIGSVREGRTLAITGGILGLVAIPLVAILATTVFWVCIISWIIARAVLS